MYKINVHYLFTCIILVFLSLLIDLFNNKRNMYICVSFWAYISQFFSKGSYTAYSVLTCIEMYYIYIML